jgi:hypothetical protein
MTEITLKKRYPHSREEDITDAFMRGYFKGKADRRQGYYIKGENGEWYCSNCKRIDDKYSVANFCWYCGARMVKTDE